MQEFSTFSERVEDEAEYFGGKVVDVLAGLSQYYCTLRIHIEVIGCLQVTLEDANVRRIAKPREYLN